jgi:hypothetical protein
LHCVGDAAIVPLEQLATPLRLTLN